MQFHFLFSQTDPCKTHFRETVPWYSVKFLLVNNKTSTWYSALLKVNYLNIFLKKNMFWPPRFVNRNKPITQIDFLLPRDTSKYCRYNVFDWYYNPGSKFKPHRDAPDTNFGEKYISGNHLRYLAGYRHLPDKKWTESGVSQNQMYVKRYRYLHLKFFNHEM